MKHLRSGFYLGFILLMMLAACGPGTPTATGLVNKKPLPAPNVLVTVVPPVLAPACTPPMPTVGMVTSYCANQIKGLGGITYTDLTYIGADGTTSWLVGDSIPGSVSCNLDNTTSVGTCSGPQNGSFQVTVCSSCNLPPVPGQGYVANGKGWACSTGYMKDDQGNCVPIDPKQVYAFCPAGSHFDNALQDCADNVTNKLASACPPGFRVKYLPELHSCLQNPYPEVYNCQTFPLQLGACVALNKVPNVVPFCQNNDANIGGANITFPAGSTLSVDIKSNHLDSCTPGATQPDGTQLFTCLGTAGGTFDAKLCTDPATCTTTKETLGACAGRNNQGSGPGPAPCIPSRGVTCP